MGVAVRGDDRRAGRAGPRARRRVPRPECERSAADAVEHDQVHAVRGDAKPRHRPGVGPRPRLHLGLPVDGARPRALEQVLGQARLRGNPQGMGGERDAEGGERDGGDERNAPGRDDGRNTSPLTLPSPPRRVRGLHLRGSLTAMRPAVTTSLSPSGGEGRVRGSAMRWSFTSRRALTAALPAPRTARAPGDPWRTRTSLALLYS